MRVEWVWQPDPVVETSRLENRRVDTMSGTQAPVACGRCNGGNGVLHSNDCWQTLKDENTALRAYSAKFGCAYGMKGPHGCSLGYPGCACADDILVFDMERGAKVGAVLQVVRLGLTFLKTLPLAFAPLMPFLTESMKKTLTETAQLVDSMATHVDSLSSKEKQG